MTAAAERWAEVIAEFERSGLGLREFAEQRGVNAATMKWWRSRLRVQAVRQLPAKAAEFVELVVEPHALGLRVRLERAAVVLEVERGVDLELLRSVVDALC